MATYLRVQLTRTRHHALCSGLYGNINRKIITPHDLKLDTRRYENLYSADASAVASNNVAVEESLFLLLQSHKTFFVKDKLVDLLGLEGLLSPPVSPSSTNVS